MEKNLNLKTFDTKKLALSSLLLAMSVAVNLAGEFNIVIAGASILRIRFGGPFWKLIAVLFGGVYGGIAGALNDIICFLIKPMGPYLWPLTLVEFLKGLSIGLIWWALKNSQIKQFKIIYTVIFSSLASYGVFNLIAEQISPESVYMDIISGINIEVLSIGLLLLGMLGFLALIPAWLIAKQQKGSSAGFHNSLEFNRFLKLFLAVSIPCLVFNTVNSVIFYYFYIESQRAFVFYWLIRFIKEMISVMCSTYIMIILLKIYERVFHKPFG